MTSASSPVSADAAGIASTRAAASTLVIRRFEATARACPDRVAITCVGSIGSDDAVPFAHAAAATANANGGASASASASAKANANANAGANAGADAGDERGAADRHVSYRRLNRMADAIARDLQARHIGPEQIVGIGVDHTLASVASVLGVLKSGAAFLPLDPAWPDARLQQIAADSRLSAVLIAGSDRARFARCNLPLVEVDSHLRTPSPSSASTSVSSPAAGASARRESSRAAVFSDAASPAYIIYTSGSTGAPKGVIVTQGGLANHAAGFTAIAGVAPDDVVLQFASLAFDASYEEILPTLCAGGRLVLRTADMGHDIRLLLDACAARQVTVLDLPTAFWHLLTRLMRADGLRLPESVRLIVLGGEAASPAHVAYWDTRVGTGLRLLNTYGPTEGTIIATAADLLGRGLTESDDVPLGASLPGTAAVPHGRAGACAVGETGELWLSGAGVARGYLGAPGLTADRFVPDDAAGAVGARAYRTGDLAVRTEAGDLCFRGRSDHQVKVNGHRVQLEEVEQALCTHPSIAACAVMLRDNRLGGRHLVAYCLLTQEERALPFTATPLNVSALRAFLRERLPEFMIPGEFSFLEKFLLNAQGKIDRAKLPEIGHLDRRRRRLPDYQRPAPGVESRLAAIWCDVLDLDAKELSAEDPFEYIGGNSLYSIQVRFKAQEAGLLFKASDLHLRQSIRGLAACCQTRAGSLTRARHTLLDYTNLARGIGASAWRGASSALLIGRRRRARVHRRTIQRFYETLPNHDRIVYLFFTRHQLHWLATTAGFVPAHCNLVLIGAGLADDEVRWVRERIARPFLAVREAMDLDMIWDILFDINKRHFGWLDVDCLVMNPSIFDEMTTIAPGDGLNCLWTHAACGPTKRPFHVVETYFLFFNIDAIARLREAGVLPRPSATMATVRQAQALTALVPADERWRTRAGTLAARAFAHRLLGFDFARLILFQLVANARGYRLNRVRFFTEIDTFNPYNYYSDEAIHVFPSIRDYDAKPWTGPDQQTRLATDYLLMVSMFDELPASYGARRAFLESKFPLFPCGPEQMRGIIRTYLAERGVTEKTFSRAEFRWLADAPSGPEITAHYVTMFPSPQTAAAPLAAAQTSHA